MKRLLFTLLLPLLTLTATIAAPNPDIKDILSGLSKNLPKGGDNNSSSDDSKSGSSGLGGLFDQLQGVGNALGLIPSQTIDAQWLTGQWTYSKPAISFKSDNFLEKAGGLAMSSTIEGKLATYYDRLGLDNIRMTFAADSTFSFEVKKVKVQGTIEPSTDPGVMVFNMKALGKISLGKMNVYVNAENNNTMAITFDVSKLLNIIKGVGSLTSSSTIKTVTGLLDSYEGLTAGFRMTRQQ